MKKKLINFDFIDLKSFLYKLFFLIKQIIIYMLVYLVYLFERNEIVD